MILPPLTALHYFAVAAKHLSFVSAAKELNVTESAISRQMKLLASFYAQPLFIKKGRGIMLTENGRLLLSVAEPALQSVSQISTVLLADDAQLSLNVTTSFAIRWLLPKLAEFEKSHPSYKVQMQASTSDDSIRGKVFDVQICYFLNAQAAEQKKLQKFMDEWLVAVCAPSYLETHTQTSTELFSLEQLAKQRLILNEMTGRDWRLWAEKLSLASLPISSALKFEQDDVAIQAAVAGHGIALANVAYIQRELSLGSLVPATEQAPIVIGAHYLNVIPTRQEAKIVQAFCNWLIATANSDKPPC